MKLSLDPVGQKIKIKTYDALDKRGASNRAITLTWHYLVSLWEQIVAVIPISLLQILVLLIFFQQGPNEVGLQAMGLISAMVGLVMFLDGLRVLIIPLAELIGQEMPKTLPTWAVLIVAFFLGVLVTYAEPAIAALRPLAELVDPNRAPYLYYLMNQQQEFLVLSIGIGVGCAAVVGTLRFLLDWSLKPLIYSSLAVTIGVTCYMQWGNVHLQPIIGMAWDCGGVTTGPVTVPILLSLGIGVMRTQRQKKLAIAALEGSVNAGAGQALEGFGIVTLASLFPVLTVELFAILLSLIYTYDEVLQMAQDAAAEGTSTSAIDESPLKEVIFAIRSIMPLILALFLIVWLILRRPLPEVSFWLPDEKTFEDPSVRGGNESTGAHESGLARASVAGAKWENGGMKRSDSTNSLDTPTASEGGSMHGADSVIKAMSSRSSVTDLAAMESQENDVPTPPSFGARFKEGFMKYLPLIVSIFVVQVGMILFNIGLTYGFTALGSQTGQTLPAGFLTVSYDPDSPYYSYAGGLIIVILTTFFLGILATRAEPALNVLGRTVDKLSGGRFTKTMLINAVALGVGVGMSVGGIKILYSLPIIYFILAKYAIASGLTYFAEDAITAVAWDSAGVTTGPVTVPFVLSIGIGFAQAVNSIEGFGMLTIMSVAPIISVLLTSLLRKPAKAARRELSKHARRLNKSFSRLGSSTSLRRKNNNNKRALNISPSTAMAAFALNAGSSMAPTPESSAHGGNAYDAAEAVAQAAEKATTATAGGQESDPKGPDLA